MFPADAYPRVIAGLAHPDDAAVYALCDRSAVVPDERPVLILSCDFFTPIVDDAYAYGAIAAANATSDIYAMGGRVILGLNVAVFPRCLTDNVVGEILRGGAEKMREAGGAIAGGHTVEGPEPLFGMAVLGLGERDRIWAKGGARPGDALVLTKPLGSGVIATAHKSDLAAPDHLVAAIGSMATLNRGACELASPYDVHAATDVTGFALVGHASEMARAGETCLRFFFDELPFLAGAKDYARAWLFPAGTNNNEAAFLQWVSFAPAISEEMRLLLLTPETSGGLLLALPPDQARGYLSACRAQSVNAWLVGEVAEGSGVVEVR